jgi:uncharacterized RDD family membrane protein YckC
MTTRCIRCGTIITTGAQMCEDCTEQQREATAFRQSEPPVQPWNAPATQPPPPSAPAKCSSCGADLPRDAMFCGVCGAQAARPAATRCLNCGAGLAGGAMFCANCGAQVQGQDYAGFGARFAALIIDALLVLVLGGIPAAVIAIIADSLALFYIIYIPLWIIYYVWGNGSGGTWGKQAVGLRVISREHGGDIGIGAGFGRWIVWWLGSIPFYLGWFWMLWDGEKRCWHDHAAGSIVIKVRG